MEEFNDQEQELESAIETVPREVVAAIHNKEVEQWAFDIGKSHGLHIDETDAVRKSVVLALLGIIKGEKLLSYLVSHTNISEEQGREIVGDIDQKIFQEIRSRMQENDAKEAEEEALLADEAELPPPAPVEEPLDRESILHEVENPTPAVAPAALVEPVPAPELPPPAAAAAPAATPPLPSPEDAAPTPETHIAEEKLAAPFSIPPTERNDADTSIAAVKKPDPYREPI